MRSRAAIHVESIDGRNRLTELRSDPPLTVRATPDLGRPEVASVHLVGSSAAPLGGDDLHLAVTVGPRAVLEVGSVAAALAQPDPAGRQSRLVIEVVVGGGGSLHWRGQPTVAVRGCNHRTDTSVRLAAGASLAWREELVIGRHEEAPGSVAQSMVVDLDDHGPLLRTQVALGPGWPGSLGGGGAGAGTRSVGTVLVAGPAAGATAERWASLPAIGDRPGGQVRSAIMLLDGPGVLLQAVSSSAGALSTFLDAASAVISPDAPRP